MASAIGIYPLGLGPKVISEAKPVRVEPLEIPFKMAMSLFAIHAALLNHKEKIKKKV